MVTAPLRKPKPALARRTAALAAASLGLLLFMVMPTGANHVQNEAIEGATYTVEFDHDGDNANWVEFQARASNGDGFFIGWARVEGSETWHYMEFAANSWERSQQGWSKFQPDVGFNVPTGKRVQFAVGMTDGSSNGMANMVLSCYFTHPAGIEQCGGSSTTTTTTPPSGDFDAPFTGFRGNEWWVQAKVGTNGPAIAKVDVRRDGGAWMPLSKQTWNTVPASWAGSYHFPQGSILQMRATAVDGRTDLSSCRQWIPASGQDAPIVPCPGSSSSSSSSGPQAFDATFSSVKGNSYWAETIVTGNMPVHLVSLRINCGDLHPMQYRADWGKWVIGKAIPSGAKVTFVAQNNQASDPVYDHSGGYVWPNATPTAGC